VRPDGKPGIYSVVDTRTAVGVVALSEREEVYLVGQYRYPTRHYSWEIVEGGSEDGEDPKETAARELEEEAGLKAQSLVKLGDEIHLSNCFSSERAVFYLAQGLTQVKSNPDATEVLALRKVALKEALNMVKSGEIKDAMSIVALYRAQEKLNA